MKRFIFAMLMLCLCTALTFAQGTKGSLSGTVSAADGVIPGATVTVTDNQTGRTLTQVSNDSGGFKFESLNFGTYTVRVSKEGFNTYNATDVKIDANREYSLNPILQVGDVAVVVDVQPGAEVINSQNSELSTTVSPRQVLDLPINGRNPLALLDLQAGVNPTSSSINGQRSSSVNYTRDGINVQDNFIRTGGFVQDRPSVDDTGEFTVVTQNAGANVGGGGSTQVQLVTPRGGQDFHGALFIYNRNSAFAANEFGNNAAGIDKPFLNRNQVGGKLSGPLPFPGFGEGTPVTFNDKAFFFVTYERFILRQTSSETRTFLRPQFRDGTFTYTDTSGTQRTVNVLTGQGLTGSVPRLGVSPVIQSRVLGLLPTAGTGRLFNGGLSEEFVFNQNNNDTRNSFATRMDADINDRNSIYFVYKYNDNADDRTDIDNTFNVQPESIQGGPTQSYLLSYTSVFGSSFTNEVRGAYNQSNPFFNQSPNFPTDFRIGGVPFSSDPQFTFQAQGRKTDQYTFQDNASYTAGKHTMRFGIDFNAQRIASETNFTQVPVFSITGTGNPLTPGLNADLFPGGISNTDRARADSLRFFLAGIVGSGSVAANFVNPSLGAVVGAPQLQRFRYETYGLYFSDQFRVTPNLTLNLGLRYDYFAPLRNPDQVYLEPDLRGADTDEAKRAALLDPTNQYVLIGANAGEPGQFFKPDRNNFGPVLGFAYSPNFENGIFRGLFGAERQTVIRGGFRMSYINDEYVRSADNAAGANAGLNFTLQTGSVNTTLNNLPSFPAVPRINLPLSFAQANAVDGSFFNTVFAVDPDIEQQQNMEYSFGIQREIGYDTAIEIRYVGGRSNSLVQAFDFNQVQISDAFLQDFRNAQFNRRNFGDARCPANSTTNCRQVGSFLNNVLQPTFGFVGSGFLNGFLDNNSIGQLALLAIVNSRFFPGARNALLRNPNAGVVDFLTNAGRYRYNSLQAEIRRRFTDGFSFQANYTFQKILTDVQGDGQTRFDPLLDLAQPELEYARADYDRTHTVNINANYELPFGRGKRFFNQGGVANAILGGFQLTSIINISSGAPISIYDRNGTLNRTNRSARQTAFSNLSTEQIKDLVGIFRGENGQIYFINPSVIAPDGSATGGNFAATPNNPAFPGQVFFNNQAGQTGNLPRNFLNGPLYFNWNAGLIKNISFTETTRLQLRAEAFNVLNNVNFFIGQNSGIFDVSSPTFGQIGPGSTYSPRIMQFAARFEF